MSRLPILEAGRSYTFRSYFELPYDPDEILAEFGYRFEQKRLNLPQSDRSLDELPRLQAQIEAMLPYVRLTSEQAKREFLVAPVLGNVAVICRQILRVEYPVKINDRLQGNLDYLLKSDRTLVVVEAKRDDLVRGFTQLAVEMVALAMFDDAPDILYGAVTIGSVWNFGILERDRQQISQDITSYRVPDDLESLARTLVGILDGIAS